MIKRELYRMKTPQQFFSSGVVDIEFIKEVKVYKDDIGIASLGICEYGLCMYGDYHPTYGISCWLVSELIIHYSDEGEMEPANILKNELRDYTLNQLDIKYEDT